MSKLKDKKLAKEMSEEKAKWLKEQLAAFTDWTAHCPHCHEKLKGTIAELKAHSCREKQNAQAQ